MQKFYWNFSFVDVMNFLYIFLSLSLLTSQLTPVLYMLNELLMTLNNVFHIFLTFWIRPCHHCLCLSNVWWILFPVTTCITSFKKLYIGLTFLDRVLTKPENFSSSGSEIISLLKRNTYGQQSCDIMLTV